MSSIRPEEDCTDWSTEIPICTSEEAGAFITDFLSGRDIFKLTEADKEQRIKHELKYKREWDLDAESTMKGIPMYKKYREEHINKMSKCDAQFVNNLHTFYGDGSRLNKTPKPHYAVDFVRTNPNGVESEETCALKSLKVSRRKVTLPWLRDARRRCPRKMLLRRSLSCPATFDLEQRKNQVSMPDPRRTFHYVSSIHSYDNDFQLPEKCNSYQEQKDEIIQDICNAFSRMILYANVVELEPGIIEVEKVLFSTADLFAYIVPKKTPTSLEDFSAFFQNWFSRRGVYQPQDKDRKLKDKIFFWNKINVVLYLPEFEKDGTQYRRARHVRRLWPRKACYNVGNTSEDLYMELDTGMLRVHKSSNETVMVLPQEWARVATAILEVRFRDAQNSDDVAEQIEMIRSTGKAFVYSLDMGDRRARQTGNMSYKGDAHWDSKQWSNIETAVLAPLANYEEPTLTGMFCGDRDCMGMCCTEKFYRKQLVSPLTPRNVPPWTVHCTAGEVQNVTRGSVRHENYAPPSTSLLSPSREDDTFLDRS